MSEKLCDVGSERAVLSGICQYGEETFIDVSIIINVNTFSNTRNQLIFNSLDNLFKSGVKQVDKPSLISQITSLGFSDQLLDKQGVDYINTLFNTKIHKENIIKQAAKIATLSIARTAQSKHIEAYNNLKEITGSESIDHVLSISEKPVFDMSLELAGLSQKGPELLSENIDEYIQSLCDNPIDNIGVPTPFPIYNKIIGGGVRTGVALVAARPKCQPLDSKILTTKGIKTYREITIEDEVIDPYNKSSKILEIIDGGIKSVYLLTFSGGKKVECCADHRWETTDGKIVCIAEYGSGMLEYKYYGFDIDNPERVDDTIYYKKIERKLESITQIGLKETRCLKLDSVSESYVTDDYLITKNCGKTTLAKEIGIHVANLGIPVLFLDSEMNKNDQLNRSLASLSDLPITTIETGSFSKNVSSKIKVQKAAEFLKTLPYKHQRIAGKEFDEVLSIIRRWIHKDVGFSDSGKTNPHLVLYDYFKLMNSSQISNSLQEYQVLGFQISKLSDFCGEYETPVLAFVQINRDGINKETSDVISGSDRLLWLCTSMSIFKRKTAEEIAEDGRENGNMKLIPVECRFGEPLEEGDYINLQMDKEKSKIKELKTQRSVVKENKDNESGFSAETEEVLF